MPNRSRAPSCVMALVQVVPTVALAVPTGDLARAEEALIRIEVAAQLGQQVLRKSDKYGEDVALAGVRDILDALSLSLAAL